MCSRERALVPTSQKAKVKSHSTFEAMRLNVESPNIVLPADF